MPSLGCEKKQTFISHPPLYLQNSTTSTNPRILDHNGRLTALSTSSLKPPQVHPLPPILFVAVLTTISSFIRLPAEISPPTCCPPGLEQQTHLFAIGPSMQFSCRPIRHGIPDLLPWAGLLARSLARSHFPLFPFPLPCYDLLPGSTALQIVSQASVSSIAFRSRPLVHLYMSCRRREGNQHT